MIKVTVELLRSHYDGKSLAISVNDKRFGPDLGPWQVLATWTGEIPNHVENITFPADDPPSGILAVKPPPGVRERMTEIAQKRREALASSEVWYTYECLNEECDDVMGPTTFEIRVSGASLAAVNLSCPICSQEVKSARKNHESYHQLLEQRNEAVKLIGRWLNWRAPACEAEKDTLSFLARVAGVST